MEKDAIPIIIEAAKQQAEKGMNSKELEAWLFLTAHANKQQLLKMQEHIDNLHDLRSGK